MPHIHTEPNQHDMTVSMYIVRRVDNQWRCLVHMHRRLGVIMQIGGHIEIDETPWQSVEHELREESGYRLDELEVLQFSGPRNIPGAVSHPVPFMVNTHTAGKGPHYHSDLCYGFIANEEAKNAPTEGESGDIRWMTIEEMNQSTQENVLEDVMHIYTALIDEIQNYSRVPAIEFSLEKPVDHFGFE